MSPRSPFALEDAVEAGDLDRARELLAEGADPNGLCHGLEEPVVAVALRRGDVRMLKLLHSHGADLRAASSRSLLHVAATASDGDPLLPALIELGFDPNERDQAGWTPLHSAAAVGYARNVKALRRAGADPRVQTPNGLSPAQMAATNGHVQLAAELESA